MTNERVVVMMMVVVVLDNRFKPRFLLPLVGSAKVVVVVRQN